MLYIECVLLCRVPILITAVMVFASPVGPFSSHVDIVDMSFLFGEAQVSIRIHTRYLFIVLPPLPLPSLANCEPDILIYQLHRWDDMYYSTLYY